MSQVKLAEEVNNLEQIVNFESRLNTRIFPIQLFCPRLFTSANSLNYSQRKTPKTVSVLSLVLQLYIPCSVFFCLKYQLLYTFVKFSKEGGIMFGDTELSFYQFFYRIQINYIFMKNMCTQPVVCPFRVPE